MIGKRHVEAVNKADGVEISAIVDPISASLEIADREGVPLFKMINELLTVKHPVDAIILATPNSLHVTGALERVLAGLPTLVEKPLAENVESARHLIEKAEKADVPILTGHHRRYNPLIARARKIVKEEGKLGKLTIVNGMCWLLKPDDYFNVEWRTKKEGDRS